MIWKKQNLWELPSISSNAHMSQEVFSQLFELIF